jgi:hypothetical protein
MTVSEMTNLWVGYNKEENFKILICALDEQEAYEIAESYRIDSHMEGKFEIKEFVNEHEHFDCDYVLTYAQD